LLVALFDVLFIIHIGYVPRILDLLFLELGGEGLAQSVIP
jgi:hypothetical protein